MVNLMALAARLPLHHAAPLLPTLRSASTPRTRLRGRSSLSSPDHPAAGHPDGHDPLVRLLVVFTSAPGAGHADRALQPHAHGPGPDDDLVPDDPGINQVDQLAVEPTRRADHRHGAIDRAPSPSSISAHYAREKDLALFTAAGQVDRPTPRRSAHARGGAAYILSELKAGFAIGAVLFLPFC